MHLRAVLIPILGILIYSANSGAANTPVIPMGYVQVANHYEISPAMLYAVALTESGQSSLSDGIFRPWPWTLNINGKGHYFSSRHAAWKALQLYVADSNSSVDIGLMQVNWRYHRSALGSTWQALDPYHNLAVAAALLRTCQKKNMNWTKRVGCYHAPNNSVRARRYAQRVKVHWEQLVAPSQEASNEPL